MEEFVSLFSMSKIVKPNSKGVILFCLIKLNVSDGFYIHKTSMPLKVQK